MCDICGGDSLTECVWFWVSSSGCRRYWVLRPLSTLRHVAGWVCGWTVAESSKLGIERMRGVVHHSSDFPSHPPLCHCLHTVQFHPHHRAGLPHQFAQFAGTTSPNATSPTHTRAKKITLATTRWLIVQTIYLLLWPQPVHLKINDLAEIHPDFKVNPGVTNLWLKLCLINKVFAHL